MLAVFKLMFCFSCGIEQEGHFSPAFSTSVHYFCLFCGRETQGSYSWASTQSASAARWTGSRTCPTAQCSMTKPADCPLVKGENSMTNSQRQWYRQTFLLNWMFLWWSGWIPDPSEVSWHESWGGGQEFMMEGRVESVGGWMDVRKRNERKGIHIMQLNWSSELAVEYRFKHSLES